MALPTPEETAEARDAIVLDEARLEGVRLAARTVEHHLTTNLTLTIGYAELLAEDPDLPERLRDMARQVLDSANQCARVVRQVRQLRGVHLADYGLPGGPLLDLGRPPSDY
jgi:hypothetical protein